MSLNSPKYANAMGFGANVSSNNPGSPIAAISTAADSYILQNDKNSQFNRTGPIILNNNKSSFNDSNFYNQLGISGPISTKNSNIGHASKIVPGGKTKLLKPSTGPVRSTRGATSSSTHNPYNQTQVISGHSQNQHVSASLNGMGYSNMQAQQSSDPSQRPHHASDFNNSNNHSNTKSNNYKLKVSKKQKSMSTDQ